MTKVSFALGQMTLQNPSWDGRSFSQLYQDAIAIVERADQLGYHSFWLAEHHGSDDGYIPSTLPMLAAMASRTQSIGLGTAVMLTPFHDPLRIAEDAAVTDNISRGRLRLGLGLGWSEEEYRMFSAPKKLRGKRLEHFVETLRGAWGPGKFSVKSEYLNYDEVRVEPKPAHPIPIMLGGSSDLAMERAARIADGYFPPSTAGGPGALLEKVAEVIQLREKVKATSPFSFGCFLPVGIGDTADEAWSSIRRGLMHTRGSYMRWAQGRWDLEGCDEDAAAHEDAVREQTVHGSPEQVADALRPLVEGLRGLPLAEAFISLILVPVGMQKSQAIETIERFKRDIEPLLA